MDRAKIRTYLNKTQYKVAFWKKRELGVVLISRKCSPVRHSEPRENMMTVKIYIKICPLR